MKKSIIYTALAGLTVFAGATTALLSSATAEQSQVPENLTAPADSTTLGTTFSAAKNETVYVITDSYGAPSETFIGNILDSSESDLPVELTITYYLDGEEIEANELAGKSGHIKIVFHYNATKFYAGSRVPFLALTGVSLDGAKFKNITIDNGKIISENDNIMIAGYAGVGLNENLGTDILPNAFTVEADVEDFELGTTYTLLTNELFAEIDTSKLNSVDGLVDSLDELESGISKILDGANSLDGGIDSLVAGAGELKSGASNLNDGAKALAAGLTTLDNKVNDELVPSLENLGAALGSLSGNSQALNTEVQNSLSGLLANLQSVANSTTDPVTKVALEAIIDSTSANLPTLYTKLGTYTGTVDAVAAKVPALSAGTNELIEGVATLKSGADSLTNGSSTLKLGIDSLSAGANQLSAGSKNLKDGIATFKTSGIDKLVNFARNDVESFLDNFRASISAAKSYKNYKSPNSTSVKFVFKTPSIK